MRHGSTIIQRGAGRSSVPSLRGCAAKKGPRTAVLRARSQATTKTSRITTVFTYSLAACFLWCPLHTPHPLLVCRYAESLCTRTLHGVTPRFFSIDIRHSQPLRPYNKVAAKAVEESSISPISSSRTRDVLPSLGAHQTDYELQLSDARGTTPAQSTMLPPSSPPSVWAVGDPKNNHTLVKTSHLTHSPVPWLCSWCPLCVSAERRRDQLKMRAAAPKKLVGVQGKSLEMVGMPGCPGPCGHFFFFAFTW